MSIVYVLGLQAIRAGAAVREVGQLRGQTSWEENQSLNFQNVQWLGGSQLMVEKVDGWGWGWFNPQLPLGVSARVIWPGHAMSCLTRN